MLFAIGWVEYLSQAAIIFKSSLCLLSLQWQWLCSQVTNSNLPFVSVPVLSQADVGVAMGGAGSDIAVEAADMVIMGDSLSKLAIGKKAAKKTIRIVYENIIFAIAVKLLIIIGCAVGIFNENAMWLAVFGDVGVCLIAIANSLRALRVGKIKNDK